MSFLEVYKKYLNSNGKDVKGSMTKAFIYDASTLMKTNPSYFEVSINGSDPVPSLIVDDSKNEDLKVISLAPSYALKRGDYLEWDEKIWLVLITDNQGDIYYRGRIAQCASEELKWVDETGQIKSIPCVFHYGTEANFGTFSDKVMTLPDGRRQVVVQLNEHTRKLGRDDRFMFGGNVFKVIDFDYVSEDGLLNLNLKDDLFNPARDNKELGIADYYKSLVNYEVEILNGNNIQMQVGESLKLLVTTMKDGDVVSNPALSYFSTDDSVLTVDEEGVVEAVSEGVAEVYVMYQSTQTSLIVEVLEEVVGDGYSVVIKSTSNTPSEIRKNQVKSYYGEVYNNGILVEDEPIVFEIYADNQIDTTSLAIIQSQDGRLCVIKNNDSTSGWIQIRCFMLNDIGVESWLRIQMRNLF